MFPHIVSHLIFTNIPEDFVFISQVDKTMVIKDSFPADHSSGRIKT